MVGYLRLRVAMGGVNLGIGASIFLLVYLNQTGAVPFYVPPLPGLFFWGLIYFILMFLMKEFVRPFYYSLPITFLLLYGFYEVGKRSRKKRQEEYERQLAEWEKQQNR